MVFAIVGGLLAAFVTPQLMERFSNKKTEA
jgi:uncharacterized membrane protein